MARVKEFDTDEILNKTMNMFWQKGYKGTSLNDLVSTTGLHKGSLYGAFKSKENLYLLSLKKYGELVRQSNYLNDCPIEYFEKLFTVVIEGGASGEGASGCFIMNSALEFGGTNTKMEELSKQLFEELGKNFDKALSVAAEKGKISQDLAGKDMRSRLLGAIFSIKEFSRFSRDRELFRAIANGVLKELSVSV